MVLNLTRRKNNMAMKMFMNAAPEYDGKSISINSDIVASVFEFEREVVSTEDKKSKKKEVVLCYNCAYQIVSYTSIRKNRKNVVFSSR